MLYLWIRIENWNISRLIFLQVLKVVVSPEDFQIYITFVGRRNWTLKISISFLLWFHCQQNRFIFLIWETKIRKGHHPWPKRPRHSLLNLKHASVRSNLLNTLSPYHIRKPVFEYIDFTKHCNWIDQRSINNAFTKSCDVSKTWFHFVFNHSSGFLICHRPPTT